MSDESKQPQPKSGPMPVLRLISGFCVGIVNGRLVAVPKLLTATH